MTEHVQRTNEYDKCKNESNKKIDLLINEKSDITIKKKKIYQDLKESQISGDIKSDEIDKQFQHIKELHLSKIELSSKVNNLSTINKQLKINDGSNLKKHIV
jgi:uncharacterized protein YoxC